MWGRRIWIQDFKHKISREQTAYEDLGQYKQWIFKKLDQECGMDSKGSA
jgi:hypothetical protein